jgi:DNA-directed RNA polymerase specialized sigma24 family protein
VPGLARADDLVQAAITRLYVRWDRVRQMEHSEAYARTVLVREYLSEQRSGSPLVLEVMPFLEVGDEPRLYGLPSELVAGDRA